MKKGLKETMTAEEFEKLFLGNGGAQERDNLSRYTADFGNQIRHIVPEGRDRTKEAELRDLYDQAFDFFVDELTYSPALEGDNIALLKDIAKFREQVLWVEANDKGRWRIIKEGNNIRGYMGIVPSWHPDARKKAGGILMKSKTTKEGQNVLEIRPYRVTKEWAAILLMRELFILRERAFGVGGVVSFESEAQSYMVETDAASQLSQRRFRESIDEQAKKLGIERSDDVWSMLKTKRRPFVRSLDAIVRTVTNKPPLSRIEGMMRDDVGTVGLLYWSVWNEVTKGGKYPMDRRMQEVLIREFAQSLSLHKSR